MITEYALSSLSNALHELYSRELLNMIHLKGEEKGLQLISLYWKYHEWFFRCTIQFAEESWVMVVRPSVK